MKPRVWVCLLAAALTALALRPLVPALAAPVDPATKPVDFDHFTSVVKQIDEFFLSVAELPPTD